MGMAYSSCHQLGVWCRTLYEAKPSTENPLGNGFGRIQAVPNKALGLGKNQPGSAEQSTNLGKTALLPSVLHWT